MRSVCAQSVARKKRTSGHRQISACISLMKASSGLWLIALTCQQGRGVVSNGRLAAVVSVGERLWLAANSKVITSATWSQHGGSSGYEALEEHSKRALTLSVRRTCMPTTGERCASSADARSGNNCTRT